MKLSTSRSSTWQNLLRSAVLVGAGLACGGVMAQKIDDVPPAVKNNVAPNFMFMIDKSGSMRHIVAASPYNPATTYGGSPACPAASSSISIPAAGSEIELRVVDGIPYARIGSSTTNRRHTSVTSSGSRVCFTPTATYIASLNADDTSVSGGVTTRTVDGGVGSATPYSGNYLNWYFGNFGGPTTGWGAVKPLSSGTPARVQTRLEIAQASAILAINSLPLPPSVGASAPVRAGLSTYFGNSTSETRSGGTLLVPIDDLTSTHRTSMTGSTGIGSLTANGFTPLASTLADIGRYFGTGYTGNVTTANGTVDLDALLYLRGTDTSDTTYERNACLGGAAPSCTSSASARPVQYWCQRSSVFMLTDGRPNNDRVFNSNDNIRDYDRDCTGSLATTCVSSGAAGSWDRKTARTYESEGSDYMDDVAKALYDTDLRPDLTKPDPIPPASRAKNNLTTYMIGFADPAVTNDPLLVSTADQGGGKFIAATDGPSLVDAFQDAITDALAKDASAAAVAVTNAQITAGSVGYASSYNSGSWYGDLEAYSLDISTGLQTGPTQWSARTNLNALLWSSRKIASFDGSGGRSFTSANVSNFPTIGPLPTGRSAGDVINWVRGNRSLETVTTNPLRERVHVLGDIINAEPVVVNYPSTGATVFQAANDGMLHVFDGRVESTVTTRGQELWAYVPRLIHNKLGDLANRNFTHKYLVDGTPAVAEVTGFGAMTRILVGGLGKGGGGYYALDITSGTAATAADAVAKVKWEFNPANMGYSYGTPLIVNTASGWKVVVTSGYRNDTAAGGIGSGDGRGRVWVLNPNTGAIEKTFTTPSGFGSSTDSLGLAHLGKLANTAADAVVRYVYGGDLKGNLWRFDLNASSGAAPVRIAELTGPSGAIQPISSAPVIGPVAGSTTKVYVYVGTGQYFSDDDVPGSLTPNAFATQTQTMYGITDDTTVATPTLPNLRGSNGSSCPTGGGDGDLVCQALTRPDATSNFSATSNAVDLSVKKGFYVDVPIANGRVNNQAALTVRGTLVFVVNEPTNITCNPGGNSYFFALRAITGGAVPRVVGGNTYFDAGFLLSNALSSRAVLVTTGTGTRGLFRLSDKTTQSREVPEESTASATPKRIYKRALN